MTQTQMISLAAAAAVAAYFYLPSIQWPKPTSMDAVQSVLRIRDNASTPEVRQACTTLLQALLQ
jgi:hypothetical protein